MTGKSSHNDECGPVIACGAAAVCINRNPGEPTSIDKLVASIKRLVKGWRPGSNERHAGIGRRSSTSHSPSA